MPARKTAAAVPKPRTPKATARPEPDDGALRFDEAKAGTDVEQVPLFWVGKVKYTMPAVVPSGWSLRLLRDIKRDGTTAAGMNLIERLCGPAALEAAIDANLTLAQWGQLVDRASDHVLGQLETSQKN